MNKRLYNTVGLALLCSFTIQAFTAVIIVLRIRVPHVQTVFKVHEYNGMLMIAIAVSHIILNWGWMKASLFKKKRQELS